MIQKTMIWVKSHLKNLRHALFPIPIFMVSLLISTAWADEKILVFPQSAYDSYIIYQNLIIFWLFIIGLIVIIRMKLKEIERTQKLGADKKDDQAPRLE